MSDLSASSTTTGRVASCDLRPGLTLIEMLVAVTASLLLLGTVMALFQMVGQAVGQSRMQGVLDRQLCSIRTSLLMDLSGITVDRDERGLIVASQRSRGYFCIVEGPNNDVEELLPNGNWFSRATETPGPFAGSDDRIVGDTDDMLLFTTQMVTSIPFSGRYGTETQRAPFAEVAYFCRPTAGEQDPRLYTLYRRQILVADNAAKAPFDSTNRTRFINGDLWQGWATFLRLYDISVRRDGDPSKPAENLFALNSLDDLTRRQNRFAHDWIVNKPLDKPHAERPIDGVWPLIRNEEINDALYLSGPRAGEEEIARNVLAFDVRVLDPEVIIRRSGDGMVDLQPGDPGYWSPQEWTPGLGFNQEPRFVDLGYDLDPTELTARGLSAAISPFSGKGDGNPGEWPSLVPADRRGSRTYDAWHSAQVGTPPYGVQLQAISVTIRLYDRSTRRIRQSTVTHSFARQ